MNWVRRMIWVDIIFKKIVIEILRGFRYYWSMKLFFRFSNNFFPIPKAYISSNSTKSFILKHIFINFYPHKFATYIFIPFFNPWQDDTIFILSKKILSFWPMWKPPKDNSLLSDRIEFKFLKLSHNFIQTHSRQKANQIDTFDEVSFPEKIQITIQQTKAKRDKEKQEKWRREIQRASKKRQNQISQRWTIVVACSITPLNIDQRRNNVLPADSRNCRPLWPPPSSPSPLLAS